MMMCIICFTVLFTTSIFFLAVFFDLTISHPLLQVFENGSMGKISKTITKTFLLPSSFIFVLWGNPSLALCYGNFYCFLSPFSHFLPSLSDLFLYFSISTHCFFVMGNYFLVEAERGFYFCYFDVKRDIRVILL